MKLNKYVSLILAIFLIFSCSSSKTVKKEAEIKDNIVNKEEREFFYDNKTDINTDKPFYKVFFAYLKADMNNFYSLSEKFVADKNEPDILKLWIVQKYFNLFKRDEISFSKMKNLLAIAKGSDFTHLFEENVDKLYSKWFKLKEKSKLNNLNEWYISGPYKKVNSIEIDKTVKIEDYFTKDEKLNFKDGGIVVPKKFIQYSDTPYRFTTYFKTDEKELVFYLFNIIPLRMIKLDDKIIYDNDDVYKFENKDMVKVKLKPGVHKLVVFAISSYDDFFIFTDKKLKFTEKSENYLKDDLIVEVFSKTIDKSVYELKDYSYSFKSLLIADILLDFSNNSEVFYKYLKKISVDNFYKDYLYYNFYLNTSANQGVKDKYMQKYLLSSLKKNPDFHLSKYEYLTLKINPNPYKALEEINKLPDLLWYLKLKAQYLKKAGLYKEYENVLNKIFTSENGKVFLYKYFSEELEDFDFDLYSKIFENLKNDLLYKNTYDKDDIKYFKDAITNHPYSSSTEYFIDILKDVSYNSIPFEVLKNFPEYLEKYKIYENPDKLPLNLNDKNSKFFTKADFFLKKYPAYIRYEDTKKIIENFKKKKSEFKSEFPVTKLLDYDVIFIEKNYFVMINRRIFKINNSEGLRRYSNLPRDNYIKLVTISDDTLQEYIPSLNQNTSEISLKKLKVGDYIEAVTYSIRDYKPLYPLYNLVSFRYKDFNQDVLDAKFDIYVNKYFKNTSKKLYLIPENGFDMKKVEKREVDNYTLYTYEEKNLKGIKPEPFTYRDRNNIFPLITLGIKYTWKDIYNSFMRYYGFLKYSDFTDDIIKEYGEIKTLKDIEDLYYKINKDFKHINSPYWVLFNLNYLNKRGNLAYFVKMILDKNGIDNSVLVFHNKYNFLDSEDKPSYFYYDYFVLEVEFKKKTYYLDFSDKWNQFNTLSPAIYAQPYLRIDKFGNIKKEKSLKTKKIVTETRIDVKIEENGDAEFNLTFTIPSFMSSGLKPFLFSQSQKRINMIFYSLIAKKVSGIEDFKLFFENHETARKPLILNIVFKKKNFAYKKGNELIVSDLLKTNFSKGLYIFRDLSDYTVLENRELPLILDYLNDSLKLNIVFPEDFKLKDLKSETIDDNFVKYEFTNKVDKNKLKITKRIYLKTNKVDVSDYKKFKETANKIKKIDDSDIVFYK